MAEREAAPMDQAVFDQTLAAELAKGTDRRVAEGRARSAGVRAYRKVHGEPERAGKAPEEREHAAAPAGGDGDGASAPAPAPVAAAAAAPSGGMYVPPPAAAVRTAPPPTGRVPAPRPGAPGSTGRGRGARASSSTYDRRRGALRMLAITQSTLAVGVVAVLFAIFILLLASALVRARRGERAAPTPAARPGAPAAAPAG